MKSILIIGLGRFGRHMAQKFMENGHEVMGIDISEERADDAVGAIRQILIGDATEERFMESIGINNLVISIVVQLLSYNFKFFNEFKRGVNLDARIIHRNLV